jgi:hypothetical protein
MISSSTAGSIASVRLGQKGLRTTVGRGEIDAALATPATIGYYNLTHKDAPVKMVRDDDSSPS